MMSKNNNIVMDFTIRQNGQKLMKSKDISVADAIKRIDNLMTKKMGVSSDRKNMYSASLVFYGAGLLYLLQVKEYLGL